MKYQLTSVFGLKIHPVEVNDTIMYKILFTNDGWNSEYEILDVFDLKKYGNHSYIHVDVWPVFHTVEEAKKVAEGLGTYEDCISHNKDILGLKESLISKYKEMGMPTWKEYMAKQETDKKILELPDEIIII